MPQEREITAKPIHHLEIFVLSFLLCFGNAVVLLEGKERCDQNMLQHHQLRNNRLP